MRGPGPEIRIHHVTGCSDIIHLMVQQYVDLYLQLLPAVGFLRRNNRLLYPVRLTWPPLPQCPCRKLQLNQTNLQPNLAPVQTILDSTGLVFAGAQATLGQETEVLTRPSTVTASPMAAVPAQQYLASRPATGTVRVSAALISASTTLESTPAHTPGKSVSDGAKWGATSPSEIDDIAGTPPYNSSISCTGMQSSVESKTLDGKPVVSVSCNGVAAPPACVSAALVPSPAPFESTPEKALGKSVSGGARHRATSRPETVDTAETPPNCQTFAGLPSTTPESCVALSPTRVYSEVNGRVFSSPSPLLSTMLQVDAGTELQIRCEDCISSPCSFAVEHDETSLAASVTTRKLSASGLPMSIEGGASCGIDDAAAAAILSARRSDKSVVSATIIDLTMSSDDEEIDLNRPGLVLASEVSTATAASSSTDASQQTSSQSTSTKNMKHVLTAHWAKVATCLVPQMGTSSAVSRRSARKPLNKPNHQTTTLVWSSHLTPCARVNDNNSAAIRNTEAGDVCNTDFSLLARGDDHPWQKECCLPSALPVEGLDTLAALDQAANSLPVYSKSNVPTSEPTTQTSIGLLSPVPSRMTASVSVTVTSPTSPTATPYLSMASATMATPTPASHPPPGKGSANPSDISVSEPGGNRKKIEVIGRGLRQHQLLSPLSRESSAASSPYKSPVRRSPLDRSILGRPAVVPPADDSPVSADQALHTDLCNSSGEVLTPDSWVFPLHVAVPYNTGYTGEEKAQGSPQLCAMLDDHSQQTDSDSFSAASDPPCPSSAGDRCGGLEPFADDQPRYARRRIAKVRRHVVGRGDETTLVRQRLTEDGFFDEISHSQSCTGY